jgi:predicted ester cyclase
MDAGQLAVTHLKAMARGDAERARACIHPEHVNRMAVDEPPACAIPGVPGFLATSAWLRLAFADLRFEVIDLVTEQDRTIAHVWMRARQTGPFVVFPPGHKPRSFPPTGRDLAVRQCHIFRIRDGLHVEHIAVRDDLGMMTQLGHLPPSPRAVARLAHWSLTGNAQRSVAQAVQSAAVAARDSERASA